MDARRSTTLDILKIFRTVKSRVLRSASSDIGPATICRSIPAAYRTEGNLPETIRLKSRLNSRARIFRTVTARALICLSSSSRETISLFIQMNQAFRNKCKSCRTKYICCTHNIYYISLHAFYEVCTKRSFLHKIEIIQFIA